MYNKPLRLIIRKDTNLSYKANTAYLAPIDFDELFPREIMVIEGNGALWVNNYLNKEAIEQHWWF